MDGLHIRMHTTDRGAVTLKTDPWRVSNLNNKEEYTKKDTQSLKDSNQRPDICHSHGRRRTWCKTEKTSEEIMTEIFQICWKTRANGLKKLVMNM